MKSNEEIREGSKISNDKKKFSVFKYEFGKKLGDWVKTTMLTKKLDVVMTRMKLGEDF